MSCSQYSEIFVVISRGSVRYKFDLSIQSWDVYGLIAVLMLKTLVFYARDKIVLSG